MKKAIWRCIKSEDDVCSVCFVNIQRSWFYCDIYDYLGSINSSFTTKMAHFNINVLVVACHVKNMSHSYSAKPNMKMVVREPSMPYLLKDSEIKQGWNSSYEISQCSNMYHEFIPWLFFTSYEWFSEVFIPRSFFQLIRFMNLPFKIKTMDWSQPSYTLYSFKLRWSGSTF